jgi:hypothetical protein
LNKIDADELEHLSAEEKGSWDEAVAYYARSLVQRDLLFDDEVATIKDRLEDAETSSDLASVDVPPERTKQLSVIRLGTEPLFDRSL